MLEYVGLGEVVGVAAYMIAVALLVLVLIESAIELAQLKQEKKDED